MGHKKQFYYWVVKLKEKNELGNDYDYYLRGLGIELPQEKKDFIASCNAEEKKNWYDDVLTNDEHLRKGYLEITKVATAPTPQLGPVVAPVVASRKRGAPTPQLAPDVAPDVDSTRKRAKTVVEVPAAEGRRHQHATRVSEYHMLRIQNVAKLNEQVNKMMKEGWQPYYGPCVEKFFTNQVMVKYE